jgi:regulatory protein
VRALRDHDRSRRELEERLLRAGVTPPACAAALATLERVGYVDDTRFAIARAESLVARGYGDGAVRLELERHRVGPEAVAAALAAVAPEAERARELVDRLGRTPAAARRLARKGFGSDALEAAFGPGIAAGDLRGLE